MREIILSGNCFWCFEAVFQKIKGIQKVESGYYSLRNYEFKFLPDDKLEAVKLEYNEQIISLDTILNIFYQIHTPTLNSWKKEECFSYYCRSSIVANDEETFNYAESKVKEVVERKMFEGEVQTKVIKFIPGAFSLAKEQDQDYYNKNPKDGYCTSLILPKFEKIAAKFPTYFK